MKYSLQLSIVWGLLWLAAVPPAHAAKYLFNFESPLLLSVGFNPNEPNEPVDRCFTRSDPLSYGNVPIRKVMPEYTGAVRLRPNTPPSYVAAKSDPRKALLGTLKLDSVSTYSQWLEHFDFDISLRYTAVAAEGEASVNIESTKFENASSLTMRIHGEQAVDLVDVALQLRKEKSDEFDEALEDVERKKGVLKEILRKCGPEVVSRIQLGHRVSMIIQSWSLSSYEKRSLEIAVRAAYDAAASNTELSTNMKRVFERLRESRRIKILIRFVGGPGLTEMAELFKLKHVKKDGVLETTSVEAAIRTLKGYLEKITVENVGPMRIWTTKTDILINSKYLYNQDERLADRHNRLLLSELYKRYARTFDQITAIRAALKDDSILPKHRDLLKDSGVVVTNLKTALKVTKDIYERCRRAADNKKDMECSIEGETAEKKKILNEYSVSLKETLKKHGIRNVSIWVRDDELGYFIGGSGRSNVIAIGKHRSLGRVVQLYPNDFVVSGDYLVSAGIYVGQEEIIDLKLQYVEFIRRNARDGHYLRVLNSLGKQFVESLGLPYSVHPAFASEKLDNAMYQKWVVLRKLYDPYSRPGTYKRGGARGDGEKRSYWYWKFPESEDLMVIARDLFGRVFQRCLAGPSC